MTMRTDFPVREMIAGRDVVMVVDRARVTALLDELSQTAQGLAPDRVRLHRTNGDERLTLASGADGRIRVLTAMAARGGKGRGWETDSLIIDAAYGTDSALIEELTPMLFTSSEPLTAILDI